MLLRLCSFSHFSCTVNVPHKAKSSSSWQVVHYNFNKVPKISTPIREITNIYSELFLKYVVNLS